MIESIKDVAQGQTISARTFNTLLREVARLSNMSVDAPLEMFSGPGGIHLSIAPQEAAPAFRVAANYSGQGKYDAYLLNLSIDAAHATNLGTATSLTLGTGTHGLAMADGERVILWNGQENDPSGAVSGTNRTHILSTNQIVVGGTYVTNETIEGSTNRARVYLVMALPGFSCS